MFRCYKYYFSERDNAVQEGHFCRAEDSAAIKFDGWMVSWRKIRQRLHDEDLIVQHSG